MLEADNINTFYDQFHALHNVTVKVDAGEFVAVYGPNGHGKSTLLKTICGLLPPSSGTIRFKGRRIEKLSPREIVGMGLVYIAEDRHLFPQMTVMENLKLGAYNPGARKRESRNIEYVLHLFPRLKERAKQLAQTLSGGEARMLAIGRGLMSNAEFLAIDEPSLGLSPLLRKEVFEKIREINRKGVSVLLVEQNITETTEMADRIYLLEDGMIVLEGTEEEVLSNNHVREVLLGI
ncbi:MAG: ABC transporter ATP-binding protein [Nitrospirota bacterium]